MDKPGNNDIEKANTPRSASESDAFEYDYLPPELDSLSDNQKQAVLQMTYQRSAPLPSAHEFAQYEAIVPGAADRIITMAESEAKHRHEMDRKSLQHFIDQAKTGMWLGFAIAVMGLSIAAWMGYLGHTTLAGILGGGFLVGLVGLFLKNYSQQKE